MTFNVTWPTDFEVEVVDAIRGGIGRETLWWTPISVSGCSVCSYDPINDSSTDSFCPTCSGEYWITTYSGISISGHVTWGYSELLGWQTGGQLDEGECRVQIKYTIANLAAVENAKWVEVDGKRMQIIKRILRGVQSINRILVDLIEFEKG